MKKALVTGASGFVGHYMVDALRKRDYEVVTTDIVERANMKIDILENCHRTFSEFHTPANLDLVVHLAANVGGRAQIDGSPLAVASNASLDIAMLNWAKVVKPKKILYFSSSAAYPIAYQMEQKRNVLLRESDIHWDALKLPDSTYGWVKLTGEYFCQFARREGLNITVVRPFSGTGPLQSLDYPLPAICLRAVKREDPLRVWSSGVRDWIHMEDCVEAALTLTEAGISAPVNICTGRGLSFPQIAQMAANVVGYNPRIEVLTGQPEGVFRRVGNPELMFSYYHPKWTAEAIVEAMVESLS